MGWFNTRRNGKKSISGNENSKTVATPSCGKPASIYALEPRILFDAAAVQTMADAVVDATAAQADVAIAGLNAEGQDADHSAEGTDSGHAGDDLPGAAATYDEEQAGSDNADNADAQVVAHSADDEDDATPADPSTPESDEITEVVIIDNTIENIDDITTSIGENADVYILQEGDGIDRVVEILSSYDNLDAVHLMSHGGPGTLYIGNDTLDAQSVTGEYAGELAQIGSSLSENGDILVYGCNVAMGTPGSEFVGLLADATGADVAASNDDTGAALSGGDWDLEVASGEIGAAAIAATDWEGVMADADGDGIDDATDLDDDGDGILDSVENSMDSITLTTTTDCSLSGYTGRGIVFSADGTLMYVTYDSSTLASTLRVYELTTPYDIDTASLLTSTTYAQTYAGYPNELALSPDGSTLYIYSYSSNPVTSLYNTVYAYTITYDVDSNISLSYTGDYYAFAGSAVKTWGMCFADNGQALYRVDENNVLYQYTLGTAYDLNTVTYTSNSLTLSDIVSDGQTAHGIVFNATGTQMAVITASTVYVYSLDTPFDISDTVTYISSVATSATTLTSATLSADGNELYLINQGGTVYQYSLGSDFDGDGIINSLDLDSDNDGITDNVEAQATAAYIAPQEADTDSDGLDDAYETGGLTPVDTDSDGTADYIDTDSDDDGISDADESGIVLNTAGATDDTDGDGLLDVFEGADVNDGYTIYDENITVASQALTGWNLDAVTALDATGSNAVPLTDGAGYSIDLLYRDIQDMGAVDDGDYTTPIAVTAGGVTNTYITGGILSTIDPLANDSDADGAPIGITGIVDTADGGTVHTFSGVGDTITLATGTEITLNADGTLGIETEVLGYGFERFDYIIGDGTYTDQATITLFKQQGSLFIAPDTVYGTEDNNVDLNITIDPSVTSGGSQLDIIGTETGYIAAGSGSETFTIEDGATQVRLTIYGGDNLSSDGTSDREEEYIAVTIVVDLVNQTYSGQVQYVLGCGSSAKNNVAAQDTYAFSDVALGSNALSGTVTGDTSNNYCDLTISVTDNTLNVSSTLNSSGFNLDQTFLAEYLSAEGSSLDFVQTVSDVELKGDDTGTLSLPSTANVVVLDILGGGESGDSWHEDKVLGRVTIDLDTGLASGVIFAQIGRGEANTIAYAFTDYNISSGLSILDSSSGAVIEGDTTSDTSILADYIFDYDSSANTIDLTRVNTSGTLHTMFSGQVYERLDAGSAATILGSDAIYERVHSGNTEFNYTLDIADNAETGTLTIRLGNGYISRDDQTQNENIGVATVFVDLVNGTTSGSFLVMRAGTPDLISWSDVPFGSTLFPSSGGTSESNHAAVNQFKDNFCALLSFEVVTNADGSQDLVLTKTNNGTSSYDSWGDYMFSAQVQWAGRQTITLSGVPELGSLSAGTENADGTWTVGAQDLAGLQYIPPADWSGTTSITATDSQGNPQAITVNVSDVADGAAVTVTPTPGTEDSVTDISNIVTLLDTDGSESITGLVVSDIAIGHAISDGTNSFTATSGSQSVDITSWNQASLIYEAPADVSGDCTITVTSTTTDTDTWDGSDTTQTLTGTYTVRIGQVDDANDDSFTTAEDVAVSGDLSINDTYTNTTNYSKDSDPANGSVIINSDGTFTYTPDADFNGTDFFTYTVSDINGLTETQYVLITVTPVNDAPVATDDGPVTVTEDTPLSGTIITNDSDPDSAVISVTQFVIDGDATVYSAGETAVISGVGELVVNTDGSYTFTPAANYTGSIPSVTYTLTDGLLTDTAVLSFNNIANVNDAPVAINNSYETTSGSTVNGHAITDNTAGVGADYDLEDAVGDLTVTTTGTISTTGGTITINSDGSFQYTSNSGFTGLDTFTYTIVDNEGATATAVLSFLVGMDANTAPVATDNTYVVSEGTPFTGNAVTEDAGGGVDFDIDGQTLGLAASSTGTFTTTNGGTITLTADGAFTYTSADGFSGTDSFEYTVTDGMTTDTGMLTFFVGPVNDAPVATDNSYTLAEEGSVTGNAITDTTPGGADSDADGDSLSLAAGSIGSFTVYDLDTTTEAGTIVISADGTFEFTAADNYNGTARIQYTLTDGAATDTAYLYFTVSAVNDAPVATTNHYTLDQDTDVTSNAITVDTGAGLDFDPDSPILRLDSAMVGTHDTANGSITLAEDGSFTYTPDEGFTGTDSFVYTLTDGSATDTATLTFIVNAVNNAPIATNNSYDLFEDRETPLTGNIITDDTGDGADSDADGNPLTLAAGSIGTFTVYDTDATTIAGIITLAADGDFSFTPVTDYSGTATFDYTVTDGELTDTATVTFNVTASNDSPVAIPNSYDVDSSIANNSISGNAITDTGGGVNADYDPDGDTITVTAASAGTYNLDHGTLVLNQDGSFTYTLNTGATTGEDTFAYTITDGTYTSVAQLSFFVGNPISNDAPVANNDAYTLNEDSSMEGNVITDAGGADTNTEASQTLSLSSASVGTHTVYDVDATTEAGLITLQSDGNFTFTAMNGYTGTATFDYTLTDGLATATATITFTVNAVQDAPVAMGNTYTGTEDTNITGNAITDDTGAGVDSDADGDGLTMTAGTHATDQGGSITFDVNGDFTYTPAADFFGTDTYTYTISDGNGGSDTATLTFVVAAANDTPAAADNAYDVTEDTPYNGNAITDNDTTDGLDGDADTSDVLTLHTDSIGTFATDQGGTVTLASDGGFTYTPPADWSGSDTYTYTLTDGLATSTATLTFTVGAVNDAPVVNADNISVTEDSSATGNVLTNDSDPEGSGLTVTEFEFGGTTYTAGTTATIPGVGSLVINTDGSFTFTPEPDYCGAVPSASYTASDGTDTSTGTLNFTGVASVNDAPVATNNEYTVYEDTPVTGNAITDDAGFGADSDVDGAPVLTIHAAKIGTFTTTLGGSITLDVDGNFAYTPPADVDTGQDTFIYTVTDGDLAVDATLYFNINPVNDAPEGTDGTITATEDTTYALTEADFGFSDPVEGHGFNSVIITTLPDAAAGALYLNGTAVTAGDEILVDDINLGKLTFEPVADLYGSAVTTFTFQVKDDGGTANGGEDTDQSANTLTIDITAVPDNPTAADNTVTTPEDTAYNFTATEFNFADVDLSDTLASVTITTLPADGTLALNGTAVNAGAVIAVADIPNLTYTPAANEYGTAYATFTFKVTDNTGLTSASDYTMTVDVTSVDDAVTLDGLTDEGTPGTDDGTVAESDMPAGSAPAGTAETTSGAFLITAGDGLASLAIEGTTFTEAQLLTATTASPLTAATSHGELAVTGYDQATGVIDYSFTLTAALDHNSATQETIALTATDTDGSTVSGNLVLAVTDDAPTAVNDVCATVNQDGLSTSTAAGNVITGTAGEDTTGADGVTVTGVVAGTGTPSGNVGTSISGTYGTLTLNADGTYTYTPDFAGNTDVQNLGPADADLVDTFTYEITDADGDTSTATLTASIKGVPALLNLDDGATVNTDGAVEEAALSDGTTPAETTEAVTGSFSAVMNPSYALATLEFTYETGSGPTTDTVTKAELDNAATTPITLTSEYGTLVITGYTESTGEIAYTYTLSGEADHSGGGVTEDFALILTDSNSSQASGTLSLEIVDDSPVTVIDTTSVTEDTSVTASDNVVTNDAVGADTNASPITGVIAGTGTPSGNVGTPVAGTYGSLTLDADGGYTYTLDNGNETVQSLTPGETLTDVFTYEVTDGDDSTDTATLTITINGDDDAVTLTNLTGSAVDEADIATGSTPADTGETVTGTFTVTAADGLVSLSVDGQTFTEAQLLAATGGSPQTVTTSLGTLSITDYNATTGVVSYSYTLSANADHSGGTATESIALVATDDNGTTGSDNLVFSITDDTPTAAADANAITAGTAGITGNVAANDTLGADSTGTPVTGVAHGTGSTPAAGNVALAVTGDYGALTLNADGSYAYALDNSSAAVLALAEGDTITDTFTYEITDSDGDTSTAELTVTITGADDGVIITGLEGTSEGTVTETDLSTGSNAAGTGETTTGTFTVTAGDGLASLTINGTTIAAGSLNGATVAGSLGTLTIVSYDNATGIVSYSYELTSSDDHTGGTVTEDFTILATDADASGAETDTDTLTITITDDTPTAAADTNAITAGTVDVTGDAAANDTLGADTTATPVTGVATGTGTPDVANVASALAGTYGSLTLNADGSYTYTLANDSAAVLELAGGETATDTFTYEITDSDGDTATATLTVTVTGADDDVTITGINADPDTTVTEADLAAGSNASGTGETTTGSFTVTAGDGLASLTIDGTTIAVADLVGSSVTGTYGTLDITSYDSATKVVGYSYTLTSNADHSGGTVTESFSITATDADATGAETATDTLDISITDDTPAAAADTPASVTAAAAVDTVTGNVADNDTLGADTTTTPVSGVIAGTGTPLAGNVGNAVDGTYGQLLVNADGTYTYLLDNGSAAVQALADGETATDTFTYEITDSDGDSSTATLTITVIGADDPATITGLDSTSEGSVEESDLSFGSTPADTGETVTGTFNIKAGDGLDSLAINGTSVISSGSLTGATAGSMFGELTITGFDTATGVVSYSYELTAYADHSGGAVTDSLTVTLTDIDGSTATDSLDITVVDDTPTAVNDVSETVNQSGLATSSASGNLIDDIGGADTTGADYASITSVSSTAGGTQLLTSGSVTITGTYGSLELYDDGSYIYTPDFSNTAVTGLLPTDPDLVDTFTYVITDGDGDTSSATLTNTIKGVPALLNLADNTTYGTDGFVEEADLDTIGSTESETGDAVTGTFYAVTHATFPLSTLEITYNSGTVLSLTKTDLDNASGTPITLTSAKGTLTISAYDDTTGEITYTYTLAGALDHAGASVQDAFDLVLTDTNSSQASGTLAVEIVDDAPFTVADTGTITAGDTSAATGDVTANDNFGADGSATDPVSGVAAGTGTPDAGNLGTAVTGSYGSLTLNADGTYDYFVDNTSTTVKELATGQSITDVYTYEAKDGDGSTTTQTLTMTIEGVTDPLDIAGADQNSDGTVTVSGTGEPGAEITITFPDGSTGTTIIDSDGNFTVTSDTPQTTGNITGTQTDALNNTNNDLFSFVDTTPPEPPTIDTMTPNPDGTVNVSGTGEPGSTVTVTFPDGSTGTAVVDENGNYGPITSTTPQTEGEMIATQTDEAGNESGQDTADYLDTTPPEAPDIATVTPNPDGTVNVSGTGEPGATVTVTFPDGSTGTAVVDESGNYGPITSENPQTSGEITAFQQDEAGNTSEEDTADYVDVTPPAAPVIETVTANPDGTVSVSGEGEPGATVTVTFPDGSTGTAVVDENGNYGPITSENPQTSGEITASQQDEAGNTSEEDTADYVDITPPAAPTIETVTTNPDGTVNVSGEGEPGATVTVTFPDGSTGTAVVDENGNYTVSSSEPQPDGEITAVQTDQAGNVSDPANENYAGSLPGFDMNALIGDPVTSGVSGDPGMPPPPPSSTDVGEGTHADSISGEGIILKTVNGANHLNGIRSIHVRDTGFWQDADPHHDELTPFVQTGKRGNTQSWTGESFSSDISQSFDGAFVVETMFDNDMAYINIHFTEENSDRRFLFEEIQATMADGRALPRWISICGDGSIVAHAPAGIEEFALRVTCTTKDGGYIVQTFAVDTITGEITAIENEPVNLGRDDFSSAIEQFAMALNRQEMGG